MRLTLTPVGKTVVLTAVVAAVFAFITGIITMMLVSGKSMNFFVAAVAAVGIVLAGALVLAITIVLISILFIRLKHWYDDWYRRSGFKLDLQKLVARGLVNPAHAKTPQKSTSKKKKTSAKKTTTSKKPSKKTSKK